jgi:hypothetical protein
MTFLQVFLLVFAFIETLNVLELYFYQDKAMFNGLSIFTAWETSKQTPEVHDLIRYLLNWLAGVKLIVIGLLVVIALTAPEQTLVLVAIVLVLTVASFYWRLHPMLREMDKKGLIKPSGRSKQLALMLSTLELGFVAAVLVQVMG